MPRSRPSAKTNSTANLGFEAKPVACTGGHSDTEGMKPMKDLKRVLQLSSALLFLVFNGPAAAKSPKPSPSPVRTITGSGLFLVDFDDSSNVTKVHVLKSTGSATLDATTIKTFHRWRAKPGVKRVKVPITYTLKGPASELGARATPARQSQ